MIMKKVLIGVLVLVALGAAAAWYWPRSHGPETLRLPGTVEIQEVRLGSRVNGRVASVPAREGQLAEPSTVLFTLDPAEYGAKREQARQKLEAAKAALDKANNGPLPEEIAEAKGATDAAAARLKRAKSGFREEQRRQAKSDLESAKADLVKAEA